MGFVSVDKMKELEKTCGIPIIDLMERAGVAVAEEVSKLKKDKILVLCGTGNNGGDGLVAARCLEKCKVFLMGEPKTVEAKANLKKLDKHIITDLNELFIEIDNSDVIVDALLGTGIKGELREPLGKIIKKVNESDAIVVSVDLPSGIDPDTGKSADVSIEPDLIVALHLPKKGLKKFKNVITRDIGIEYETF